MLAINVAKTFWYISTKSVEISPGKTEDGKLLLFETMVFAPDTEYDQKEWRYSNYYDAI